MQVVISILRAGLLAPTVSPGTSRRGLVIAAAEASVHRHADGTTVGWLGYSSPKTSISATVSPWPEGTGASFMRSGPMRLPAPRSGGSR